MLRACSDLNVVFVNFNDVQGLSHKKANNFCIFFFVKLKLQFILCTQQMIIFLMSLWNFIKLKRMLHKRCSSNVDSVKTSSMYFFIITFTHARNIDIYLKTYNMLFRQLKKCRQKKMKAIWNNPLDRLYAYSRHVRLLYVQSNFHVWRSSSDLFARFSSASSMRSAL